MTKTRQVNKQPYKLSAFCGGLLLRQFVAALLVVLGFTSHGITASVNIDFGQHDVPHVGVGAAPDIGEIWNSISNTTSSFTNLVDSNGMVTTIGVEIPNCHEMAVWTAPQVAPNLLRDYLYAFNKDTEPSLIRITGLDSTKPYNLYVYSKNGAEEGSAGATTKFTVNGTSKVVANSDNHQEFVLGDNFTLFARVFPNEVGTLQVEYEDIPGQGAAFNGFQLVQDADVQAPISICRGRQILLERELQIQAYELTPTFDFDVDRWLNANFTAINFLFDGHLHTHLLSRLPKGYQWARKFGGTDILPEEQLYLDSLVSYGYYDELDGYNGKPDVMNILPEIAATFREWKTRLSKTLIYTNFYGGQLNANQLRAYMRMAKPDILSYDYYPGFFGTRETWYAEMQKYRAVALEGYDGTGLEPLPYAQHTQAFRNSYKDFLPGESFIRHQQFASWAFGFTFLAQWLYRDPLTLTPPGQDNLVTQMFSGRGDHSPTPVFDYVAETNRQSRNLGPALIRMVSTDVRIIPGRVNGVQRPAVSSVQNWSKGDQYTAGHIDFVTNIVPLGKDPANPDCNNHSDVIVGYFRPLQHDNTGYTFVDCLSFMIVNGNVGGTNVYTVNGQPHNAMGMNIPIDQAGIPDPIAMAANTAEALGEWYHVAFDFGDSDFDSVVRLNRDTGKVEVVPLQHYAESRYYMTLYLPGGTGDLFAYWDSSLPLLTNHQ